MKGLLCNTRLDIVHPGSDVPDCFHHRSIKSVISFQEPADSCPNIAGIAFCAVVGVPEGSQRRTNVSCEIEVFVNKKRTYGSMEQFPLLQFDHRWLHYIPRRKMWGLDTKLRSEGSQFLVLFAAPANAMKCCGVHVVYAKKKIQNVEGEQKHHIVPTINTEEKGIRLQLSHQIGLRRTSSRVGFLG